MCLCVGSLSAGQGSGSGVSWTWEIGLNSRHSPTSEATLFLVCLHYSLALRVCVCVLLQSPLAMEKLFNWI